MTQSDIVSEFIHAVRVDQVCANVSSLFQVRLEELMSCTLSVLQNYKNVGKQCLKSDPRIFWH